MVISVVPRLQIAVVKHVSKSFFKKVTHSTLPSMWFLIFKKTGNLIDKIHSLYFIVPGENGGIPWFQKTTK